MTREISGLSEIIDQFDAVLVDQFGVLHDGARQFPGALAALEELAKNDIPVVALTNSGKRSSSNLKRLEKLGFHQKLFHQVLSSGELARGLLEKLPDGCPISLVSRDGETELIEGLRLNLVSGDHARPAMVVLAGIRPEQTSREAYQAMLAPHAKRGAALLLVNPDTLMAHGTDVHFGPGAVAADYAAAGGAIIPLGKPSREIFRAALDLLGGVAAERVLMIGDSPEHDISGAKALGIKTLLVRGGVQSGLGGSDSDFVMDALNWSTD